MTTTVAVTVANSSPSLARLLSLTLLVSPSPSSVSLLLSSLFLLLFFFLLVPSLGHHSPTFMMLVFDTCRKTWAQVACKIHVHQKKRERSRAALWHFGIIFLPSAPHIHEPQHTKISVQNKEPRRNHKHNKRKSRVQRGRQPQIHCDYPINILTITNNQIPIYLTKLTSQNEEYK